MALNRLPLCVFVAASLGLTMTGCSEEPTAMPASSSTAAENSDQTPESMTVDPASEALSTDNSVDMGDSGPETDGVIINDDLMVEKGYAQANP